jgi:hypothetical protein
MAKREEIQYVRYYATGSTAVKLDPQPERRKKARPAVKPAQQRIAIPFDPLAWIGTAVAVVMVLCVMVGFFQLNHINDQVAQAQTDLTALKNQHYELEKNYENGYDLVDVANAAKAMGLVPMAEVEQITIHIPEPEVVEELPWWQEWWMEFRAMFE